MPACRRGSCTRATLPTKSGPSLRPVPSAGPRGHPAAPTRPEGGLSHLALYRTLGRPGGCCPTTSPCGRPSTSRPSSGSPLVSSGRWCTTSGHSCAWPKDGPRGPHGGRPRQLHPALAPRERALRRLQQSEAQEGVEAARGRVDTLEHLLALQVGPANEQDRTQVEALAEAVQEASGESVELA